jgi:hypothetical protein
MVFAKLILEYSLDNSVKTSLTYESVKVISKMNWRNMAQIDLSKQLIRQVRIESGVEEPFILFRVTGRTSRL